jgi:hypothetical protein
MDKISFAEFVQAYKVVIATMQALQLCPRDAAGPDMSSLDSSGGASGGGIDFRDRVRSRVAVFLQTLVNTEGMMYERSEREEERERTICGRSGSRWGLWRGHTRARRVRGRSSLFFGGSGLLRETPRSPPAFGAGGGTHERGECEG